MHEDTNPERIFTKEEIADMWLRILHVNTLGDTVEYVPYEWAVPLGKIYHDRYHDVVFDQWEEISRDCRAAYFAGWHGDMEHVYNFIGGHELSREEPIASLTV